MTATSTASVLLGNRGGAPWHGICWLAPSGMRIDEHSGEAPGPIARLPLARFTAKVGAGFRQYPRANGVLARPWRETG